MKKVIKLTENNHKELLILKAKMQLNSIDLVIQELLKTRQDNEIQNTNGFLG